MCRRGTRCHVPGEVEDRIPVDQGIGETLPDQPVQEAGVQGAGAVGDQDRVGHPGSHGALAAGQPAVQRVTRPVDLGVGDIVAGAGDVPLALVDGPQGVAPGVQVDAVPDPRRPDPSGHPVSRILDEALPTDAGTDVGEVGHHAV